MIHFYFVFIQNFKTAAAKGLISLLFLCAFLEVKVYVCEYVFMSVYVYLYVFLFLCITIIIKV